MTKVRFEFFTISMALLFTHFLETNAVMEEGQLVTRLKDLGYTDNFINSFIEYRRKLLNGPEDSPHQNGRYQRVNAADNFVIQDYMHRTVGHGDDLGARNVLPELGFPENLIKLFLRERNKKTANLLEKIHGVKPPPTIHKTNIENSKSREDQMNIQERRNSVNEQHSRLEDYQNEQHFIEYVLDIRNKLKELERDDSHSRLSRASVPDAGISSSSNHQRDDYIRRFQELESEWRPFRAEFGWMINSFIRKEMDKSFDRLSRRTRQMQRTPKIRSPKRPLTSFLPPLNSTPMRLIAKQVSGMSNFKINSSIKRIFL